MLQPLVEVGALLTQVLPEPLQEEMPCQIAQALFLETDQLLLGTLLAGLRTTIITQHLQLLQGEISIALP